jgi:hypothetical protein
VVDAVRESLVIGTARKARNVMASKKAVTLDNLAALGAERLAAILFELADSNAEIKRRLRLELAAQTGSDTVATEIGKRLATLRSAMRHV